MNANLKLAASLLSGLMFYAILTIGVWYKWWLPDVLLTAIYGGMTAAGLTGGIHYGARYLTYTKPDHVPDAGKMVPTPDQFRDATKMMTPENPTQPPMEG